MNVSYRSFSYGILGVMQAKSISVNVHSAFRESPFNSWKVIFKLKNIIMIIIYSLTLSTILW